MTEWTPKNPRQYTEEGTMATKHFDGMTPEPLGNKELAKVVGQLSEYEVKSRAYWRFVAAEICNLNAAADD